MIRKLFNGQINSITIAALLVALSSLISRMLGIFRDRILAGEFGAGNILDIYYAAFRIPDLVFNLLVLGALSAGFIPVFTNYIRTKKDEYEFTQEAKELASNIINIIALLIILLMSLGIIFAPYLMKLIAPGFSPEMLAKTISLTRIMFLSPLFLGISSIFGGILQSFKKFFVYSLAPIFYNVGIIIGALYLTPIWGVYGLAWGVVLGAIMHMLVQWPAVKMSGFSYRPIINLKNDGIKKIGKMMVPRTLTLAITQFNLLVITMIASTLAAGSLTAFNFANNLQYFPIGIFGISFAIAAFPTLSALSGNKEKLINSFSSTFRQILFFIVPSTVLLLTLRAQIIRVIFGTGQFDWEDTLMTIDTLGFFTISLFAQASIPLLVRMFYARQNSRTPFYIGLFTVVLNVILSLWLAPKLGVGGLALAFSIANIFNFLLLWIILKYELGSLDEQRVLYSVIKFSIAALAAGLAIQEMKLIIWPYIDMTTTVGVFTQGFISGLSGLIVYFLVAYLLRSEELLSFWSSIKRRMPGKKLETVDRGEARGI